MYNLMQIPPKLIRAGIVLLLLIESVNVSIGYRIIYYNIVYFTYYKQAFMRVK